MPKMDWDKTGDGEYAKLPDGEYLCEIKNAVETPFRDNNSQWQITFEILKGDLKGRYLFDRLFFTEAAAWRVKILYSRLGLKTEGQSFCDTRYIIGKSVWVTVRTAPANADGKRYQNVEGDGYRETDETTERKAEAAVRAEEPIPTASELIPEEEIPF